MSTGESLKEKILGASPYRTHAIVFVIAVFVCLQLFDAVDGWKTSQQSSSGEIAGSQQSPSGQTAVETAEQRAAIERDEQILDRLTQLEQLARQQQEEQRKAATSASATAVSSVRRIRLASMADSVRNDIQQCQTLLRDWTTLWSAVETSEAGRRIATSPEHRRVFRDLLDRPRPTPEDLSQAEQELTALTENLSVAGDADGAKLTTEHLDLINDLGQKLTQHRRQLEEQLQLARILQEETRSLAAGEVTLVSAIAEDRAEKDRELLTAIQKEVEAARQNLIRESADKLVNAEKQLAALQTDAELAKKQREAEQLHAQLQIDQEEYELQKARQQLEREFARDRNEIDGLLMAFTAPGFKCRLDDTRGPVSLSYIEGEGGLEPGMKGLSALFFVATGNSDRPRGGLPEGVGGSISSATPTKPIQRAQDLLIKYGKLMVEKGLLAN